MEIVNEAAKEVLGQNVVVQWLVFHQFATASGVSIGTSLLLFMGVRVYMSRKPKEESKNKLFETFKNLVPW
jgi:hypothetical protein